jgi:hypothetical protein
MLKLCLLMAAILDGGRGHWKQIWHEWSLNDQLSKLYPVTQNSIQDGHHHWT